MARVGYENGTVVVFVNKKGRHNFTLERAVKYLIDTLPGYNTRTALRALADSTAKDPIKWYGYGDGTGNPSVMWLLED